MIMQARGLSLSKTLQDNDIRFRKYNLERFPYVQELLRFLVDNNHTAKKPAKPIDIFRTLGYWPGDVLNNEPVFRRIIRWRRYGYSVDVTQALNVIQFLETLQKEYEDGREL